MMRIVPSFLCVSVTWCCDLAGSATPIALMENHYHLLIETPGGNVSRGDATVQRGLDPAREPASWTGGASVPRAVQGDYRGDLLELCRYVGLNPVRAGMVTHLERYPWSSYPATRGLVECPGWFTPDWVLSQFGAHRAGAKRRYGYWGCATDIGVGSHFSVSPEKGRWE